MLVQALLYSGHPNPEFYLTPEEDAELERRVGLLDITGQLPPSQLGYTGFRVGRNLDAGGGTFAVVRPGIVQVPNVGALVDDQGVEFYLLLLARERIGMDHPYILRAPFRKITEFVGHASGDSECFCFDRRLPADLARNPHRSGPVAWEDNDRNRIYPHDLLPETGRLQGRWKITVEFVPED